MEAVEKTIDIEKAIRAGNNRILKSLPGFAVSLLKKLVREDEINATIYRSRHLEGVPFVVDVLHGWNVKIDVRGSELIPSSGRFVFAANHPVGGIDALAIYSVIYSKYSTVVSPANQLLNYIPNLRTLVLGLDLFGKTNRETAEKLDQLYASDTQIMIFPAGEVSRRKRGVISDITWQKSFITKAVAHKRDIIPVHISGRNSNLFYIIASLRKALGFKSYIETLLLPREMWNQRNSSVTVTVGNPISYNTFTNDRGAAEWARYVKEIVYALPGKGTTLK
jgi:putative hemolysin